MMDDEPEHSAHVAELALDLFDGTEDFHHHGDDARELLEAAALLANVGLFVSHSKHHKHTYYVIRNSDGLSGFTDHEIEIVALVARYHRKSAPSAKHAEFAVLRPVDQDTVRALAQEERAEVSPHDAVDAARHEGQELRQLEALHDPVSAVVFASLTLSVPFTIWAEVTMESPATDVATGGTRVE